jgi:hypothetical protein
MDTLAVRLTIPPAGVVEDFHLQVNAPCRAHKEKRAKLPGKLCALKKGSDFQPDLRREIPGHVNHQIRGAD